MIRNHDTDWVSAAMADDSAVASALLTLFRHPPPPENNNKKHILCRPSLGWTVKQPRSKHTPRASPTTPLSWSGASEESYRKDGERSKVPAVGGININKRSRKKKTLTELREEETLLVKERGDLKRKLEAFYFTLENQKAMNESLKRYKIDLQSQPPLEIALMGHSIQSILNQMQPQNASFAHPLSSISTENIRDENGDAFKRLASKAENSSEKFVLPDLNLPFNGYCNIELL